jgi:glycosyltransferase involved in cell wall biosynthesis
MPVLSQPRIGYVPYDETLRQPGDRRRFVHYADARGIPFQVIHGSVDPGKFDVIVLSARADISYWRDFPQGGAKLVFDLIDSYLSIPQGDLRSRLRGPAKFLSRENRRLIFDYRRGLEDMCRRADALVCSTPEQKRVLEELSRNVHPILDIHTDLAGAVKRNYSVGSTVNLVWEGLPYTLKYFEPVAEVLRDLAARRSIAVHLITDLEYRRYAGAFVKEQTHKVVRKMLPDAYLYQWNEHLLSRIVTACDIAIIPLDLADPLAVNKPENKLLIFWRMGMPTLVSATPAYRRVAAAAGTPEVTCASPSDWVRALEALIEDDAGRAEAGLAGLRYVRQFAQEERLLAAWDAVLETLRLGHVEGYP